MSNKPIPGVTYPTQKPFTPGTGNARDSATAAQKANDTKLNNLNKIGGIRKKGTKRATKKGTKRGTRKRGGTTGTVAAPQMKVNYTPTGGPGQDPNSIMAANAQTSSQIKANSEYDSQGSKKGGGNKYQWGCKSGGNKYQWGCKSGGKKTKKRKKKTFWGLF